jgi:hypothetical protein
VCDSLYSSSITFLARECRGLLYMAVKGLALHVALHKLQDIDSYLCLPQGNQDRCRLAEERK